MPDLNLLNEVIKDQGIMKKSLAAKLGISPYGLSLKLEGKNEFKVSEANAIADLLHLSSEMKSRIFFSSGVHSEVTEEY